MTDYKQILIDAGKQMLTSNLTIETWGNISISDGTHIYITPSGMPYHTIDNEDICVLDMHGNKIEGKRKPSIEKMLHVRIYQTRKDVQAILHTHPIDSTVFAVLGKEIPCITDEMAQVLGGSVQCAKYALPGSDTLANNACIALSNNQAVLLQNHGAICVGENIQQCFKVAKVLETSAQIYYKALCIGNPILIKEKDIEWMQNFIKNEYGQKE